MWSRQRMVFHQWSCQTDDYNRNTVLKPCLSSQLETMSFSQGSRASILLSPAAVPLMLSPQETLLGCISEMLENITNSTKMLEIG